MATLHIEHAIVDFDSWKHAFDRFADLRAGAGVRGYRVMQPVDDPRYVVAHLEFDTADQASAFEEILRTKIWASSSNSPALAGTPQTKILDTRAHQPSTPEATAHP